MPQSLSTTLTDVRSRINESVANFWTDSDLTNWINEACRDIARRSECLWSEQQITVVAGTQVYSAPAQLIRIHKIEFAPSNSSLTYPVTASNILNMDQVWGIQQNTPSSYPCFYSLWGNPPNLNIKLFPSPAAGGTLNVFYYRIPTPVASGSDNLDIPEGWYDLVTLYCQYIASRKNHNPEWKEIKADYETKLQDLTDKTYEYHDQANFIFTGGGMVPDFIWGGDFY